MEKAMTAKECAAMIGVSPLTLWRMAAEGLVPPR